MRLPFLLLLTAALGAAETVRIDLAGSAGPVPVELRPGLFYNNTTSQANAIFDTCGITVNLMRCGDISYFIRTSSSYQDVLTRVRSLRSLYQHRAALADRFVIEISGMPYWLSRSRDSTPTGSGWRYFQTVGPRDYALYDSMVRGIASEISTWGFPRWYETWNEPDLNDFWNGSEAELIGLHRRAAGAIRSADPQARVGGFAVNFWNGGIDLQMPVVYGWIPDSLVRRYAATAHLIDSCALSGAPLDFVSWHTFSSYPYHVDQAADFFRRQLDNAGLYDAELLMTEYSVSSSAREKAPHAGIVIRQAERLAGRSVRHSIAAYQDFSSDPTREFFGDYGMLSRGALCKPAFKGLQLLNEVALLDRLLPVGLETDCRLTVLASRQGTRVRVLLANSFLAPILDGYNDLLWNDEHRVNTLDLAAAGYTSWSQMDSVIMGIAPPHGPPEVVAAFEAAQDAYLWADQYYYLPRTVQLRLAGLADTCRGAIAVVDTFTNNVIWRYDSLLGAGWTRSAAVSYLYADQDIARDSVVVADSTLELTLQPNAVVLLDLDGVRTAGIAAPAAVRSGARLEPVPTVASRGLRFGLQCPRPTGVTVTLFDAAGRARRTISARLAAGRHALGWDGRDETGRGVAVGVYYWRLEADNLSQHGRVAVTR